MGFLYSAFTLTAGLLMLAFALITPYSPAWINAFRAVFAVLFITLSVKDAVEEYERNYRRERHG